MLVKQRHSYQLKFDGFVCLESDIEWLSCKIRSAGSAWIERMCGSMSTRHSRETRLVTATTCVFGM